MHYIYKLTSFLFLMSFIENSWDWCTGILLFVENLSLFPSFLVENELIFLVLFKLLRLSSKPAVFLEVEEFLLLLSICDNLFVKIFDTDLYLFVVLV